MQELLEDLQQKHPVVRDQSSWGNDTNPFCCDRCWENSPLSGPPETESVAAPPADDSHGEVYSSPWVSDHAAYSVTNPQPPASEDTDGGDQSEPADCNLTLGDDEGDVDGAAPTASSNAAEREYSRPSAIGSIRGSEVDLEVRGGEAHAALPAKQKAGAVAAAFSAHLRGVDKYPLELARLCRFAQFLTEHELLREAYEVSCGRGRESTQPTDCTP